MKVTIEYNDPFDAKLALSANQYLEFVEELERFLISPSPHGAVSRSEILDKFTALRDLYKV